MNKLKLNCVFPLAAGAGALTFVYLGITKFGFWDTIKGPMGGFYPTIIGALLFAVSVYCFFQSFRERPPRFPKEDILVGGAVLAVILGTFLIGLLPSVFLYLLAWMKLVEKASWKTAARVTLFVGGTAWLIFSLWLKVPFPMGLIGKFL